MTILDELCDYARERVRVNRTRRSLASIRSEAESLPAGDFQFEHALKGENLSFICECKKASPSKGVISDHFDYLQIARDYENAGADAISVLTEPKWFLGSDAYLNEIARAVRTPCLRKDFTVDPYMIYEAKLLGASAVLLIVSIVERAELSDSLALCDSLGLSALVEAHDAREIEMALECGARVIGVNNRNLKTFSVDTQNSCRLRTLVPEGIIFVSESGVKGPEDIPELRSAGVNAVLIGEALMRSENKKAFLKSLKEAR